MGEVYGPYPTIDTFAHGYDASQVADDLQTVSSMQYETKGGKLRRHAACDECRKRKLKCTGEPVGCSRCIKNGIPCIYSQQKQMGRPRKRQKTDEGPYSPAADEAQYEWPPASMPPPPPLEQRPQIETQSETPIDPSLSNIDHELTDLQNICPGPMAQTIRQQRETNITSLNIFEQDGDATSLDYSNVRYPTDISLWPDFSTFDKLPLPLTTRYDPDPSNDMSLATPPATSTINSDTTQPYYDPDTDPSAFSTLPTIPSCPCLPNLYLALSTLATLSTFPTSQHTIDSLLAAHKTAHSVIYCPICPQQYQSGSQNLMLGCTLLNVLAYHWHRIRHLSPEDLKKGYGTLQRRNQTNGATNHNQPFMTVKEGQAWRTFVHQLIRAYVFGDAPVPKPPTLLLPSTAASPNSNAVIASQEGPKIPQSHTLQYIISALERRQRQWHNVDTPTDEFPDRSTHNHPGHAHTPEPRKSRHNSVNSSSNANTNEHGDPREARNANVDSSLHKDNKEGNKHSHDDHDHCHEKMPCLIIVSHSKNIIRGLDEL